MEANNTNDMNGSNDKDYVGFPVVHIKEEPLEDDDSNSKDETQDTPGISFELKDADVSFINGFANLSETEMWKCLADTCDTFTNEDLAEVGVDHDNSTLTSNAVALADPENSEIGGSTDSPVFIPISSSEIKQIQGSSIRTVSEGDDVFFNTQNHTPCLRLMLNTNGKMEQASGGTSIQIQEQANSDQVRINSGGAHGTVVNEIRITSVSSGEAGGEEHATNKRKTRGPGRKAKNAKIAESVTANKKAVPAEKKVIDSAPNIVVHHTAANYPPPVQTNAMYSVSGSNQLQENGNVSFKAISMPDFASFDTSAVLMRRHANGVEINKIPGPGANRATFSNGRMGQPGATPADVKGAIFRGNGGIAERESLIASMQSGGNNQQLNDRQAGTKMEQLFTSRLSGAGTPRRSVVTPSYIQRNMSLYTQLTAPTSMNPSDFDKGKLTQDKWMQCPNPPSPLPNCCSTPRISERGTLDNTKTGNAHVNKPIESPSLRHVCISAPATENNIKYINSGASGSTIAHVNGGVYNGTTRPPNFTDGTSGASFAFQMNPNGHSHYSQPPVRISGWMEQHHRVVSDLRTRLQLSALDNFELKVKMHYIARNNKELMCRLRKSLEETESLKYKNQQLEIQADHPTFYANLDAPIVENLRVDGINDVQPCESGQKNRSSKGSSDSGHGDSSPTRNNITIKNEPEDEVSPQSGDVGNISEGSAQVTGNDSQQELTGTANDASKRTIPSTIVNVKQAKRGLEQESTFPVAQNKKHCTDGQN